MTTLVLVPSEIELQWLADVGSMTSLAGPLKAWREKDRVWAIAGIGAVASALSTSVLIGQIAPRKVVLVGIAGAFPQSGLELAEVVQVEREYLADLGYETDGRLVTLDAMGLTQLPMSTAKLGSQFGNQVLDPAGKRGSALSVNRITASKLRAAMLWAQFHAELEQMEGAGAAMACRLRNVAFFHVRAISNFVGPRDPATWQIQPACSALKLWLARHL